MKKKLYFTLFFLLSLLPLPANADDSGKLLEQADSLYAIQQYKEAFETALRAEPMCKGTDSEADCLNLLAVICIRLADYETAAKYAKQCYALDEQSGDADMMSSSLNTLAAIYMSANLPHEAEQYVLKGVEMARKADNPARMATLLAMASEVYHALGDDQKALTFINEAYELDQSGGRQDKVIVRLAQKASVLIGLHEYAQAEEVLKRVIPALRQSPDRHSLAIACNKMGMALLSQQREEEAVPYYREAADIFLSLGDIYNEVHARRGLYETLWKTSPDEAKQQFDRFNELKDSIYSTASAESLARFNAEFGNDWLQLENHTQRRVLYGVLAVGCVIIGVLAFVGILMRRRHRRQTQINAELAERISQLNEKYNLLERQYDNAISTVTERDENDNLPDADRDFIDRANNVADELLRQGRVDAATVAEKMGMSLYQFRHRLTETVGVKPQDFIVSVRMRRARQLLDHHSELNINEIATLCAYNDTSNFTRAFKSRFGLSPTQYLDKKR